MFEFTFTDPIFSSKINVAVGLSWQAFLDRVFGRYAASDRQSMEERLKELREKKVPPQGFVFGYGDQEVAVYLDAKVDVGTVDGQGVVVHECEHIARRVSEAIGMEVDQEEWFAYYTQWVYEQIVSRILRRQTQGK